VHRFGKTEASWEAEQSGWKKGDRGMWFIITHCALYFSSVSEDARRPGSSLESWSYMTMIEGEAWSRQLLITPLFDHRKQIPSVRNTVTDTKVMIVIREIPLCLDVCVKNITFTTATTIGTFILLLGLCFSSKIKPSGFTIWNGLHQFDFFPVKNSSTSGFNRSCQ
jgi:hypothetical protein